jgi:hypothetical protein
VADNGFTQIINAATRGFQTLDISFTMNRPDLFKCSAVSASVLSDHKALVICGINHGMIVDAAKAKRRITENSLLSTSNTLFIYLLIWLRTTGIT